MTQWAETQHWPQRNFKKIVKRYAGDEVGLKLTENEFKMNNRPLTLYLNHFNESKLMFGRTLNLH